MHPIYFKNKIEREYLENLKRLFYFNQGQKKYHSKIMETVEKYGDPIIKVFEGNFNIILPNNSDTYNLFALDSLDDAQILGCLVYIIENDLCVVVHSVVDEHCSLKGEFKNEIIFLRLIEKLKHQLDKKKIKYLRLPYSYHKISVNSRLLPTKTIIS